MSRLDLNLCQETHALRESGMSWAAIAKQYGVSTATVKYRCDLWTNRQAWKKENPQWAWAEHVERAGILRLEQLGYRGRDDCMERLGGETLPFETWSVKRPRRDRWERIEPALWLEHVNQIREALGVLPYVPPKRPPRIATAAELKAAQRLLERHGYTVTPPPASS